MFGLNTGLLGVAAAVRAAFAPTALFAASEVGVWYDPSDLSTMFQDSSGTTPVTADGQPVGLILDKRKASTSRTSLPVMTCSATVSQVGNVLTFSSSPAGDQASGAPPIVHNSFYRMSFTVSGTGSVVIYVGAAPVTFSAGTYTLKPWYSAWSIFFIFRADTGGFNGTVTFSELVEYSGNHASQGTAAARPLYKTDGTYHWLQFDGVDDCLLSSSINFTATDKMSVFAGSMCESSGGVVATQPINTGFAFIYAPPSNRADIKDTSKTLTAFSLSTNYVHAVSYDISQPTQLTETVIRRNGTVPSSTDYGTGVVSGNFGDSPLEIGDWATAYKLKGRIYSLIIRGALSSPQEITDTETWVNSKTGAF